MQCGRQEGLEWRTGPGSPTPRPMEALVASLGVVDSTPMMTEAVRQETLDPLSESEKEKEEA